MDNTKNKIVKLIEVGDKHKGHRVLGNNKKDIKNSLRRIFKSSSK